MVAPSLQELALQLPEEERMVLAESLLLSLIDSQEEIASAWREESIHRLEAFRNGNIQSFSEEEVFQKYHAR